MSKEKEIFIKHFTWKNEKVDMVISNGNYHFEIGYLLGKDFHDFLITNEKEIKAIKEKFGIVHNPPKVKKVKQIVLRKDGLVSTEDVFKL